MSAISMRILVLFIRKMVSCTRSKLSLEPIHHTFDHGGNKNGHHNQPHGCNSLNKIVGQPNKNVGKPYKCRGNKAPYKATDKFADAEHTQIINWLIWVALAPCAAIDIPREASKMFQCIKYEDKREAFDLKIHSFSTLDRIKKYDGSDNEENAEKPYSIEVGEIERTINLYAIASTKFRVAV